jgi:transcriptional regulator with XRE-family HTH domain
MTPWCAAAGRRVDHLPGSAVVTSEVMGSGLAASYGRLVALAHDDAAFGGQLRAWRQHRRMSQLELGLRAAVSTKHISYIETGRSRPSREMVLHLANCLNVPLRDHNALLLAAGYAPRFAERELSDEALHAVSTAVRLMLENHDPLPAIVVDRRWNLVDANAGAWRLSANVSAELLDPPVNVIRLSLHPKGMSGDVENFEEYAHHIVERLRRQVTQTADADLADLLDEVSAYPGVPQSAPVPPPSGAVLPLRLRVGDGSLSLFSTIATIGAPLDVTVAELAIEAFFPADEPTRAHFGLPTSHSHPAGSA